MKKPFSTLDIIVNKLKRDRLLRRYKQLKIIKLSNSLRSYSPTFTLTFISYKRKLNQIKIAEQLKVLRRHSPTFTSLMNIDINDNMKNVFDLESQKAADVNKSIIFNEII